MRTVGARACLSLSRPPSQRTAAWGAYYQRQKFVSHRPGAESLTSGHRHGPVLGRPLFQAADFSLCFHMAEEGEEDLSDPHSKGTHLIPED